MPCCHLLPGPVGNFFVSLQDDAEQFATYVGGRKPANLTSALHFEMKLWPPTGILPHPPHTINEAEHNSWQAMRAGYAVDTFTKAERAGIFSSILKSWPPVGGQNCCIEDYDRWLLKNIQVLRASGLNATNAVAANLARNTTTTLASYGRSQKLLNMFVKYELCWQQVGQWKGGLLVPYQRPALVNLAQFLCALHAPIDSIVLKAVVRLPVGKWLQKKELQKKNGDLRQLGDSPGVFRPWSQLDCLRTYYGFQLILRRLAMATWPQDCGCSKSAAQAITDCAKWFNATFGDCDPNENDWVKAACELPANIIENTVEKATHLSNTEETRTNAATSTARAEVTDSKVIDVASAKASGNEAQEPHEQSRRRHANEPEPESPSATSGQTVTEKTKGPTESAPIKGSKNAPAKTEIYLQKTAKNIYTKIVNACGDAGNLGLITKSGELWLIADKRPEKRYLISEIIAAGGPDLPNRPRFKTKGGSTPAGGSGFQGGVSLGSPDNCRQFLKLWFIVHDCP